MSLKLTPVLICLVTVKIILGQYTITKSKDYVVTGSSITFTCNTGSSVSGILWITSLNFPVSQESGTSCGGCQPQYQCSCSGGTVFNLTINNIDLSYDGTGWACGPAFGGTQSNTEIMIVVAPVNYTFTEVSGSRPNSLDITEGNSAIFTCVVQGAKPEPTVSQILWYVDSNKLPVSITGSPTTTDRLTTLSVTYTASREHDGQKVFCAAENDLMINQSIPAVNSSNKIELHILTEEGNSTSVPTTTPNLGSGSGCNLVCIILITVISVTGLCIIITCCLISLRNQNTKKNDKTTNIELNSKMNIEKSQTKVSVDTKAEENCNIQENIDKKQDTEDVETVKDRIANESSHSMSGNHGSDEDNGSSEDYSYNLTNVKPSNQPVSKDVYKELTKSEVCQQSVTDSLNITDMSNNTAESQHPTRQNYNNVDHLKTKHITTIDVNIKL